MLTQRLAGLQHNRIAAYWRTRLALGFRLLGGNRALALGGSYDMGGFNAPVYRPGSAPAAGFAGIDAPRQFRFHTHRFRRRT
jgi:hypothetical protein